MEVIRIGIRNCYLWRIIFIEHIYSSQLKIVNLPLAFGILGLSTINGNRIRTGLEDNNAIVKTLTSCPEYLISALISEPSATARELLYTESTNSSLCFCLNVNILIM